MSMNVKVIPTLDERINDLRIRTAEIVNKWILPNEAKLWGLRRDGATSDRERRQAVQLREESRRSCGRPGCGHRTCPRSTAGWAWISWPTPI
jgi:acyl-CoA dehydrogenase